jgi:hypothetical protein
LQFTIASATASLSPPVLTFFAGNPNANPPVPPSPNPTTALAGSAALAFAPTDVASLARLLDGLLQDAALRDRLRAAGKARIKSYSWDATARGTAAVYREVIARAR